MNGLQEQTERAFGTYFELLARGLESVVALVVVVHCVLRGCQGGVQKRGGAGRGQRAERGKEQEQEMSERNWGVAVLSLELVALFSSSAPNRQPRRQAGAIFPALPRLPEGQSLEGWEDFARELRSGELGKCAGRCCACRGREKLSSRNKAFFIKPSRPATAPSPAPPLALAPSLSQRSRVYTSSAIAMSDSNGKKEQEEKKKPAAPVARTAHRRKKKGPSASVKIPQGRLRSIPLSLSATPRRCLHPIGLFICLRCSTYNKLKIRSSSSLPHCQVQAPPAEAGAHQGLLADGAGVHPEPGNQEAARGAAR